MDSVTHLLLGGAIGAALAPAGQRRAAILAGAALNTLPDLDVLLLPRFTDDPVMLMTWHRSFLHSVFVLPLIGALVWWVCRMRGTRVNSAPARWFWLIQACLLSHPLMDACTVYGTSLLWPLEVPPTMWSLFFIIEPAFTLWLLLGCVIAWCVPRKPLGQRGAIAGLVLAAGVLGVAGLAKARVDREAERTLAAMGLGDAPRFSTPMPFSTLLWRVVAITPSGYVDAERSVFDRGPMVFRGHPSNTQALAEAMRIGIPAVTRLDWFNHGFMRARVQDGQLVLSDLRMGLDPDYTFNFAVAELRDEDWQAMAPQQIQAPLPISGVAGFRRLIGAVWQRTWHEDDTPLRALILGPQAQAASANDTATPASSASK
ncbi:MULTISPECIES: metal-dependent hydrolase [Pseudoxanthomonas]|uniref:Inner membrane protein n=1 Tax=Pseudoxanthomonas winnipegensis TaxID=2480810 RepID=A0AAW8G724_9GAMM|nr:MULTISPECIES: metal-dependent hydrolase [Pseudoxanthomonas]MDQ1118270.1 inner membrane protein [Pseudoxanthomonas winnipegensis]MDR6138530.1 inner membrane protein [Pseudoxanthomonas sp. SORGH_AS_0997]